MMASINKPTQFIDQMASGDRVALFYEDHEYARMLDYRYIKNGLLNGEQCVYLALDQNEGQDMNKNNNYHLQRKKKDVHDFKDGNSSQVLEFLERDMDDNGIEQPTFLLKAPAHWHYR